MRKRRIQLAQTKHAHKVGNNCEFCAFNLSLPHVLEEHSLFWIVQNIFPYHSWDTTGVTEHLLLVPKRHVDSITHFSLKEQAEFMKLLGSYESAGYSMYARAPTNKMKSVTHQHTHLIKLDNKVKPFIFWLKKPRLLLTK